MINMSETLAEWIIVLVFFLLVISLTFGEAVWLNRKGWANFGKSLVFSALTNFIGFAVGFFVVFVVSVVIMMIVFDGAINKIPAGDYGLIAILLLAALFTPTLLTVCKRIFLAVLKMQTGKAAWLYSVASSISILAVSLGVPFVIGYFYYR